MKFKAKTISPITVNGIYFTFNYTLFRKYKIVTLSGSSQHAQNNPATISKFCVTVFLITNSNTQTSQNLYIFLCIFCQTKNLMHKLALKKYYSNLKSHKSET